MSSETLLGPIRVKVGEPIVINLDDNPSTGFTVCLTQMPGCVALAADDQIPGATSGGLVGVPGTRRFTFVAVNAGEGPLTFNRIKFTHPDLTIEESSVMEKRFVIVEA